MIEGSHNVRLSRIRGLVHLDTEGSRRNLGYLGSDRRKTMLLRSLQFHARGPYPSVVRPK